MAKWIKIQTQEHTASKKLTLVLKAHIESEGMEKVISSKW